MMSMSSSIPSRSCRTEGPDHSRPFNTHLGEEPTTIGNLPLVIISKPNERYPMIKFGRLKFQDSMNFLKAGLGKLIDSQCEAKPTLHKAFPILAKLHPYNRDQLKLLRGETPFPL